MISKNLATIVAVVGLLAIGACQQKESSPPPQKIAGAGEGVRGSGHRHRIARPVAIAV